MSTTSEQPILKKAVAEKPLAAGGTPTGVKSKVPTADIVARSKQRKRRKKIVLWSVLVLVVLGVALMLLTSGKEEAITVQTEKVSTRTITEVVQATGKIQPEVQVKVSPEVSGEIVELPFKEGDAVKKGELIAKIKPTTFEAQYEAAEASLLATKARAEQQHASLIQSKQELTRAQQLLKQKLVSQQDFEASKAKHDMAEASYNSSKYEIASSESQLRQFRESLNKTSVLAPMTGVISSLISQLGEKVVGTSQFSGTEMMTVSDLSVMNAMVDVDENDVVNIKLGNPVKVSIDAFPKRVFTGKVIEIANSAKLKGGGTQDQSTNFTVKVRIDNLDGADLRPGMSCTARIETVTKENVTAVPLMAVTRRLDENAQAQDSINKAREASKGVFHEVEEVPTIVFVNNKGKAKQILVKTGISDNSYVEVLSGLKGDEEVIKGNFRAVTKDLEDGKAIKIDNTTKATKPKP
jgi:HlyD family secretion protein